MFCTRNAKALMLSVSLERVLSATDLGRETYIKNFDDNYCVYKQDVDYEYSYTRLSTCTLPSGSTSVCLRR